MPIKRVQFPDGSVKRIEVPEGASNEQIIAFVQSQQAPKADFSNVQSSVTQPQPQRGPMIPGDRLGVVGYLKNNTLGAVEGVKQLGMGLGQSIIEGGPVGGIAMRLGAQPPKSLSSLIGGEQQSNPLLAASDAIGRYAKGSRESFEASPAGQSVAGKIGAFGGQYLPAMAVPGGGAKTLLGKVGAGALEGAAQGSIQPVEPGQSRAGNVGVGAAFGAGGNLVSGLAGKAAKNAALSAPVQESVDLAREAGIPLHLSQVSKSRALKGLSSVLNNLPFTGGARANEVQQEAFMRRLAKSFGEDTPHITEQTAKSARDRIGKVYDSIFNNARVELQPSDLRQMAAIEKAANQGLTDDEAAVVSKQLQRVIDDFADGNIEGSKYQSLREALGSAADSGKTGRYIKQLKSALENAANRSVGPEKAAALKKANGEWANLRTVEDALKQVSGAGGNVRPAALWNLIRNGSTKEMRDLAKMGQNVLKDPIPNSGTPERQFFTSLATLGGGAGLAGLPGAAGGLAGAAGLARLLNSNAFGKLVGEGKGMRALAGAANAGAKVAPAAALETKKRKDKK